VLSDIYNKTHKMTQEHLRMQMLAGIITEGQYKAKLNEANEDLIILKNLTDKRHNELYKWMTNNLKTEPYNFGLLSVNTGNDNDFGLQIKKFKQEDVSVLIKYLEDNRYLEDHEDYDIVIAEFDVIPDEAFDIVNKYVLDF
jgi:hypothetical protein